MISHRKCIQQIFTWHLPVLGIVPDAGVPQMKNIEPYPSREMTSSLVQCHTGTPGVTRGSEFMWTGCPHSQDFLLKMTPELTPKEYEVRDCLMRKSSWQREHDINILKRESTLVLWVTERSSIWQKARGGEVLQCQIIHSFMCQAKGFSVFPFFFFSFIEKQLTWFTV